MRSALVCFPVAVLLSSCLEIANPKADFLPQTIADSGNPAGSRCSYYKQLAEKSWDEDDAFVWIRQGMASRIQAQETLFVHQESYVDVKDDVWLAGFLDGYAFTVSHPFNPMLEIMLAKEDVEEDRYVRGWERGTEQAWTDVETMRECRIMQPSKKEDEPPSAHIAPH